MVNRHTTKTAKENVMRTAFIAVLISLITSAVAWAADPAPTVESNKIAIDLVQTHANYLWTLVAAAPGLFHAGRLCPGRGRVHPGQERRQYHDEKPHGFFPGLPRLLGHRVRPDVRGQLHRPWFGTSGFFLSDFTPDGDPWVLAFWMFQVVFAATAATIVSGAMAERTNFVGYLIYSVFLSAIIYPIFGSWAWGSLFNGSGWLEGFGFIDFAGSTVVHSVGGWAALAGTLVLGPRLGKYTADGKVRPILGHNIPLAALGVFILWLGWFGFNPGSTTTADKSIAMIFVNTNLAAAAGAALAMIASWIKFGKPEVGMSLNGALAGLVGITAGCANVSPGSSIAIGAIAGVLVVFSVLFFDKIRIDDPVGAISVHGVCGAWGTLAAGIFNMGGTSASIIGVQLLGIAACFAWTFPMAFIMFKVVDKVVGLRVSPEEETEGLDLAEHGGNAYPDFEVSSYAQS